MSEARIVEFAVFQAAGDAAITERAAAAAAAAGLVAQYAGPKKEDAGASVHVTVWTSAATRSAFAAASGAAPTPSLVEVLAADAADVGPLLASMASPTTEVFTAYGVVPGIYAASARQFRSLVDAASSDTEGYCASAVLETTEDVAPSAAALEATPAMANWAGPAVKLVVGWTSKEAHLEAKTKPGPVRDQIELLRQGLKAGSLYHVILQRL